MAEAVFLLNSGRVSSQQIYHTLRESDFDGVVEHEPMGAKPRPRHNMRNEDATDQMIAQYKRITPTIERIDTCLEEGRGYINVGWTSFAMAYGFERRWGKQARFVGLVRNPYSFAASLLTHRFFLGRNDLYQRAAIIQGDSNVHYTTLAKSHDKFNPFEKCLFHWLELNRFILDFCTPRKVKIWRFEELYGTGGKWRSFYKDLSGEKITKLSDTRDRHQNALEDYDDFKVRPTLARECKALCGDLGYGDAFVAGLDDTLKGLREKYATVRA